jgi:hypothetical protein
MPRRFRLAGFFFGVCMTENSYTAFGELAVAENIPFVQAKKSSGASADVSASLIWYEDV